MKSLPETEKRLILSAGEHLPIAGRVTSAATSGGTIFHIDRNLTGQNWWKYVRIYKLGVRGRVARISSVSDGEIVVDRVWKTGSKTINAPGPEWSIQYYAIFASDEMPNWGASPPQDGDSYVLCEDARFWSTGTPAIVTVKEVLDDDDFKKLNRNDLYDRLMGNEAESVKSTLQTLYAGQDPGLVLLELPSLFLGNVNVSTDPDVSAIAFTPNPVNLQEVDRRLYFSAQFGAEDGNGDGVFEAEILNAMGSGSVVYIDGWDTYHRYRGGVHCATNVKRKLGTLSKWWELQPG